ncbi:MAG: hypothetical protein FRX48_06677 [Lasallia pustulata]|uniref:Uncharacterized protein n=1 Tax=Lasallia pustulata TaxID=136370 RepID=A0A5M8PKT2_9LECA|nr:MAG: hypothetical protein FRX48_06677 [Lasallia pustulata]
MEDIQMEDLLRHSSDDMSDRAEEDKDDENNGINKPEGNEPKPPSMHLRRLPPTLRLKLYEIMEDLIKDVNQYNATQGYIDSEREKESIPQAHMRAARW